jgi:D-alanyl-lipoteichoic acid acyltransferase DltB (MBOAT superfamily)
MQFSWADFIQLFTFQKDAPIDFLQPFFWGFFFVLMILFSFVYTRKTFKNTLLLGASLFFYYKTGGFYFWLLIFSTITDFYFAVFIEKAKSRYLKTFWLVMSLFSNLGILAYYKYAYLLTDFFNYLFKTNYVAIDYLAQLSNTLTNSSFDITKILLPVGISFYVFQTLSYTIDVYRGKLKALSNIADFALFVTFFPQLVAGPIVRASDFLPQIEKPYELSQEDFAKAIFLILGGMTKKVLADYLGVNLVNRVFENPFAYTGFENLMGVYGFAIQIYFDFSGYTDIAIGLALLLGFRLPLNFNEPYKASNITDFWRRWHISLSTWLRDYLYIPLGGNRRASFFTYLMLPFLLSIVLTLDGFEWASGYFLLMFIFFWILWLVTNFRDIWGYAGLHILAIWGGFLYTQKAWYSLYFISFIFMMWLSAIWNEKRRIALSTDANLLLTMLLGGLWHGSHIRFIIWGGLHGLALGLHKFWMEFTHKKTFFTVNQFYVFFAKILTFHFICVCWIFFRANPININGNEELDALWVVKTILEKILFAFQTQLILDVLMGYKMVFLVLFIAYTLHWMPQSFKNGILLRFTQMPDILKAVGVFLWIFLIYYQVRSAGIQQFIYFQF